MQRMNHKQSGFTLVEIAIVLVIIGLLLGGVLKGQEMIENSRIKSVVNDMNGISAAYNSYFDRYRAIPGDEAKGTMDARGWAGTAGGNGNGVLDITLAQTFTNGGEQEGFWRALRASGLAGGDPTAAAAAASLPRAGTGGVIGVTVGAYGFAGLSVCVSGLTTKQAAGVDTAIDGTLPSSNVGNNIGRLRGESSATNPLTPASTASAAGAGTAYDENAVTNPWTMCHPI